MNRNVAVVVLVLVIVGVVGLGWFLLDPGGGSEGQRPSGPEARPARKPGIVAGEVMGVPPHERSLVVRGLVVSAAGEPIPNAVVAAHRPQGATLAGGMVGMYESLGRIRSPLEETTTDGEGAFSLVRLSPGIFRIEAAAEGFATGAIPELIVAPETEHRVHRISLLPGASLSGKVSNPSGEPVAGAVVTVLDRADFQGMDMQPAQAVTDEGGRFRLTSLRPSDAIILVAVESYPMTVFSDVEIGWRREIDLVIGGSAEVYGVVTGPSDEKVAGARVRGLVERESGGFLAVSTTDADGRFRLENLPAGDIPSLTVDAAGYAAWPGRMGMFGIFEVAGALKEGDPIERNVRLSRGTVLTGTVSSATDGSPFAGAEVTVLTIEAFRRGAGVRSTVSGKDGRYRIEALAPGPQMVIVKAEGQFLLGLYANVDPGMFLTLQAVDPDFPMVNVGPDDRQVVKDLQLGPAAVVRGVVLSPDGDPVGGARVRVANGAPGEDLFLGMMGIVTAPALTNAEGEFTVSGPPSLEEARLIADADGYVTGMSLPLSLTQGQEVVGVVIRLRRGGRLEGTLLGFDGRPLAGASVRIVRVTEGAERCAWGVQQEPPVFSDAVGRFARDGFAPGPVVLLARAAGHQPLLEWDLAVPDGGTTSDLVLRLEEGLTISGTMRSENGVAIAGARIKACREERLEFPVKEGVFATGPDGTFEVSELAPGSYELQVDAPGYVAKKPITAGAGRAGLLITLYEPQAIAGRVFLPDGSPASSVWVVASSAGTDLTDTVTDREGRFTIEGLVRGEYTVTVEEGFDEYHLGSATSGIPARPFATTVRERVQTGARDLAIHLDPSAIASGFVMDRDGVPLAEATVIFGPGNGRYFTRTDARGAFRMDGLTPGPCEVNVGLAGYHFERQILEVPSTGIRLTLRKNE